MRGVFAIAFLDQIQSTLGVPISKYFDLIAGTSTGGIIALALGMGMTTSEILDLYKTQGKLIFPNKLGFPYFLPLRASKHGSQGLRNVLEKHFGSRKFGEAGHRLLIPALEEATGRVHIYKTAYHSRLLTDYRKKAVEVGMATAAAPVYLPAHESDSGLALLDGGLWANNPTGIATAEAVGLLKIPCEEVRVLSVGTTDTPIGKRPHRLSLFARANHMLAVSMAAQSSGSLGVAKTLVGGDSVFRVNLSVAQGVIALDQTTNLSVVEGLGRAEGRRASTRLRGTFFTTEASPFEPVYSLTEKEIQC